MHRAVLIACVAAASALTDGVTMSHPLTEADAFTADVSVPDDGDDRNAASVEVPLQALTNRTRYLLNLLGAFGDTEHTWTAWQRFQGGLTANVSLGLTGAANEILYTDETGTPTPRIRVDYIPLDDLAWSGDAWRTGDDLDTGSIAANVPDAWARVPIRLPHGARLVRVEARIISASESKIIWAHRNHATAGVLGSGSNTAPASGLGTVLGVDVDQVVDTATGTFVVRLRGGNAQVPATVAGTYAVLSWVRRIWLDPGPRNF
jgi:hypothetical protein